MRPLSSASSEGMMTDQAHEIELPIKAIKNGGSAMLHPRQLIPSRPSGVITDPSADPYPSTPDGIRAKGWQQTLFAKLARGGFAQAKELTPASPSLDHVSKLVTDGISPENNDDYADFLYAQDIIVMSVEPRRHRAATAVSAARKRLWPAILRLCSVFLPRSAT